jgi:hypothetical protein
MCTDIENRGQFARRCQPFGSYVVGSGLGMPENMFDHPDPSEPTGTAG